MVGFENGRHATLTELFHDAIRTDLFTGIKGHGSSNVEQAILSLLTPGQECNQQIYFIIACKVKGDEKVNSEKRIVDGQVGGGG